MPSFFRFLAALCCGGSSSSDDDNGLPPHLFVRPTWHEFTPEEEAEFVRAAHERYEQKKKTISCPVPPSPPTPPIRTPSPPSPSPPPAPISEASRRKPNRHGRRFDYRDEFGSTPESSLTGVQKVIMPPDFATEYRRPPRHPAPSVANKPPGDRTIRRRKVQAKLAPPYVSPAPPTSPPPQDPPFEEYVPPRAEWKK